MTKRATPEQDLQKQVAAFLDVARPKGMFYTSIGHGVYGGDKVMKGGQKVRTWVGKRQREMGQKPGVPDMIFCINGRFAAIELKAGKNTCTDDQNACIGMIREAGGSVAVCRSLDEVIGTLKAWGVPVKVAA